MFGLGACDCVTTSANGAPCRYADKISPTPLSALCLFVLQVPANVKPSAREGFHPGLLGTTAQLACLACCYLSQTSKHKEIRYYDEVARMVSSVSPKALEQPKLSIVQLVSGTVAPKHTV